MIRALVIVALRVVFLSILTAGWNALAVASTSSTPAAIVRDVLALPEYQLDYGRAKLAFDQIIDPSIRVEAALAEIDRLVVRANAAAGAGVSPAARLAALRRVIYESGDWNGGRAFTYDHDDPLGQNVRNKLLSTYLATRRGNCVSMPILFLVVADRMGVDLALSTAPLHLFLRYSDESGRVINLEATSGALPARPEWIRQNLPMSDRAIESGLYMRTLTRREAVAHMATTVVDYLMIEGRFQEAIEVARVILRNYPLDGYALVKLGTAYGELMRVEITERFPNLDALPPAMRERYLWLAEGNRRAFQAAEALGWEPSS